MRRELAIAVIAVVMLVVTAGAERIMIEGVLVRVNDRIVTVSDFEDRLRQELTQIPAPPSHDELKRFAESLLQEVVNELVLLERATEKRLTVDEAQLDAAMENLRQENNLVDDEAWEQALASSGLTVEMLRDRYRRSMLLQRAVQGEIRPSEITEEELRQDYERDIEQYAVPEKVDLEQVFLPGAADGSDATEVLRRAQSLVNRVRGGTDLKAEATLAGVALQELGSIPVGDLRPDLAQALANVPDGGLADPLPTTGGVQIIRLVRRIPAGYQPFDEVKEKLRRERSAKSYEDQTRGLVDKLKDEYLVEIHEERLAKVLEDLDGA